MVSLSPEGDTQCPDHEQGPRDKQQDAQEAVYSEQEFVRLYARTNGSLIFGMYCSQGWGDRMQTPNLLDLCIR